MTPTPASEHLYQASKIICKHCCLEMTTSSRIEGDRFLYVVNEYHRASCPHNDRTGQETVIANVQIDSLASRGGETG